MAEIREGFQAISSGWTLIDGIDDLTERIDALAIWAKTNGPLLPDEEATVALMIKAQIARGMPDLIRRAGLEREYGLPPDDDCPVCGREPGDCDCLELP